jgi:hypothetical protein
LQQLQQTLQNQLPEGDSAVFTLTDIASWWGIVIAWRVVNETYRTDTASGTPSCHQSLILKSQRTQARASLLQAAHWLERAASANGNYPLTADVPASVLQIDGQRYKMTVTSTVKATPSAQHHLVHKQPTPAAP